MKKIINMGVQNMGKIIFILFICITILVTSLFFIIERMEGYYELYLENSIFPMGHIKDNEASDIILYGDSRVYQWRKLSNINELGYSVRNNGVNGMTSEQALIRLHENVISHNPKIIFIQIGINDLKSIPVLEYGMEYTMERTIINIGSIIDTCLENGIHVIFSEIIYPYKPSLTRVRIWSEEINQSVTYVNNTISEKYKNNPNVTIYKINDKISNEELLLKEYAFDTLHFNENVYQILTEDLYHIVNNIKD